MKFNSKSRIEGEAGYFARRYFLKLTGAAAAGFVLSRMPVAAGPFTRKDFDKLVPADKKLHPAWVKSLFARGEPTVYRGAELEKIGMPIGGICAGQLYLGGDGQLWHWDIFNQRISTDADHYAHPLTPSSPLEQGFAVRVTAGGKSHVRKLDRTSWRDVTFNGEYPIGHVEYRDADSPVTVSLEAFSPFIPLNVDDSSLPATVMRFKLANASKQKIEIELAGWLENTVALKSSESQDVLCHNRVVRRGKLTFLECSASAAPEDQDKTHRPDIVFDDFERDTYAPWTTEGTAFGSGPVEKSKVMEYQGDLAMHGRHAVNTHSSAPSDSVGGRDAHTGTLTSPPFTIERNYIRFLIGGGSHPGKTAVNLLVDGKVVLSATGANDNKMKPLTWGVRRWAGKTARIQAVDKETGGWGNIGLDYILFSDQPDVPPGPLAEQPDFGTMGLALIGGAKGSSARASLADESNPSDFFPGSTSEPAEPATKGSGETRIGSLARRFSLKPGQTGEAIFILTWNFPNLKLPKLPPGQHYATRFPSALAVAEYVTANFNQLASQTRLWHDTWYDSTLPYWFLDRTFINASILATSTCHRLVNGRFWGWEGVGCCEGTCGHVWQYAHSVARLFAQLERDTRERVDFGIAQQPDGEIFFRAEFNNYPAIDAQAGTVLRALREHQMGTDTTWLKRNWPGIRKAIGWLIAKDANGDGLIEGNQHNTLDTDWFGPVAWLSGLYLAALRAGEEMGHEVGDETFARQCHDIFSRGQPNLVAQLFDGEYFINKPDPKHPDAINSGTGCEIDQVFGQSWAFQVGLPRVLPKAETVSALKSLWRYNFTPDVGPYRAVYKPGRWYAMAGEGGLLMCTFPRRDWDFAQAKGKGSEWAAGYFDECMNGFEYQVAGHMLWEGLTMEGLAIARMLHDRYHASRRNPWNEVECGDHYARSMASHGVYLAACGFNYHGPRGYIGFAPRLTPEDFKCAFTSAEGWGTYSQKRDARSSKCEILLRWGRLKLNTVSLALAENVLAGRVHVKLNRRELRTRFSQNGTEVVITLNATTQLAAKDRFEISVQERA
jgi:uncharacterized protein (DUF608 family)